MALTPDTLVRHELIGLEVRVVDAPNPDLIGLAGAIHVETARTLVLVTDAGTKQVPKAGTTFRFTLPDGTAVEVEGDRIVAPPARRTERGGDSAWV